MIPKIIHYCWFSKNPKPNDVLFCIETWKKYLPDYQIKEWNEKNFDYKKNKYTKEAYISKKYAFVSDVCRLHALYNEGGLYFDTDIEVIKSFRQFEDLSSFVGYEVDNLIGTGVIGALPHTEWIGIMLQSYENECFIRNDGSFNLNPNTQRLTKLYDTLPSNLRPNLFPMDVFCASHWKTKEKFVTENTVSIHHYKSSWVKTNTHKYEVFENKICSKMHLKNRHILIRFFKKFVW